MLIKLLSVIDIHPNLNLKIFMFGLSKIISKYFPCRNKIIIKFRLFDRSQTLDEKDHHRINHIFNKLVTSVIKYER